jgi:hypothetical protein
MAVSEWWREVWSIGEGRGRTYCGIARIPDGYAVDVFEGDSCIESESFGTRLEAAYAVDLFRRRYGRGEAADATEPIMAGARAPAASGRR